MARSRFISLLLWSAVPLLAAWFLLTGSVSLACGNRLESWSEGEPGDSGGRKDLWEAKAAVAPGRLESLAALKQTVEADLVVLGSAVKRYAGTLQTYRGLLGRRGLSPDAAPDLTDVDMNQAFSQDPEYRRVREAYLGDDTPLDEKTLARLFWSLWHLHTVIEELEEFYQAHVLAHHIVSPLTRQELVEARRNTAIVLRSRQVPELFQIFLADYGRLHRMPPSRAYYRMVRKLAALYAGTPT